MATSFKWGLIGLLCVLALSSRVALGQRGGGGGGDDDDFDDSGYDDSGYNSPQNHDAEGTNQNQNYSPSSEEDLDDDDDVDESNMRPQVAAEPQNFLAPVSPVQLAGQQSGYEPGVGRYRRSTEAGERDIEQPSRPLSRHRRHSKYIGPVYTYVKTDKHAHYKWGVKHKVGKHLGR